MSTPPNQVIFKTASGQPDFTQEVAQRSFEPERPFSKNSSAIIYRTRFMQLRAYYAKPADNTPHPDLPQVYFADDVDFQDRTSGLIEWTRVYTTLPNSWNDYESTSYPYPGFLNFGNGNVGRVEFSQTVTSKTPKDYFLVGPLFGFTNELASYDDFSNAAWAKTGINVTTIGAGGPQCADSPNVSRLTEDGSNGRHFAIQGSGDTGPGEEGAVFAKIGTCNVAKVAVVAAGGPNYSSQFCTVDLRTGTVLINSNDSVPRVAAIDNGWWRIGVEKTTVNLANISLAVMMCDDSGNDSYVGTNRTMEVWRGQLTDLLSGGATVPPTVTPDGTNYPVTSVDNIPQIYALRYFFGQGFDSVFSTFGSTSVQLVGLLGGLTDTLFYNVNVPNGNGNTVASTLLWTQSNPSLTNYNANVAGDNANSNSYSIEADGSIITQFAGSSSMWERKRRLVKAR